MPLQALVTMSQCVLKVESAPTGSGYNDLRYSYGRVICAQVIMFKEMFLMVENAIKCSGFNDLRCSYC